MEHLSPQYEEDGTGRYLLNIFWELTHFRSSGFAGPEPLQPSTIRDWCELTYQDLTLDELKIIIRMDAVYLSTWRRIEGTDK